MKQYIEIEIKFKVDDFKTVRQKLVELGAKKIGQAFQRAVMFDFADGSLKFQEYALRVRTGFKNDLTFKGKKTSSKGLEQFKQREEIEVEIDDADKVTAILKKIGLKPGFITEKERETWQVDGVEVELDQLPFGKYIEMEGDPDKCRQLAGKLDLDMKHGLPDSYPHLYREWCKQQGIKPTNSVFKKD